jgi:hypothetical protein
MVMVASGVFGKVVGVVGAFSPVQLATNAAAATNGANLRINPPRLATGAIGSTPVGVAASVICPIFVCYYRFFSLSRVNLGP